ncbi:MAG: cupin domain-containing protein [Acidobacteria bacterium]|nr:cupin domain-containing protein [Acidobacteriota bacterium]
MTNRPQRITRLRHLAGNCFLGAVLATAVSLQAQTPSAKSELIRTRTHPVKFDVKLGAGVAVLSEDRLRQIAVTLIELPPGKQLAPRRELAEEMIYIVSGQGYTLMWNSKMSNEKDSAKIRYNWKAGDLLSPSMNSWRQHSNASATETARYIVVSTAPLTERMFRNAGFLTGVNYTFDDRWKDSLGLEPRYTPGPEGHETVRMKVGHLLPNLRDRKMLFRGNGMDGITITPEGDMASNHLIEMEVREFTGPEATSPEHRHVWETFYLILSGDGYATLQDQNGPERRLDWTEGDVFLVGSNEWHNHKPRAGSLPRFLQIKPSGYFHDIGLDPYLMTNKPAAGK